MALSLSISNPPVIRFQVLQSYAASCLLVIWFPVTCPVWSPNHQSFFFTKMANRWYRHSFSSHKAIYHHLLTMKLLMNLFWCTSVLFPFSQIVFFPFYLKRNILLKKQASSNTSTIFLAYTHSFLFLSLFHEHIFSLSTHTPPQRTQINRNVLNS